APERAAARPTEAVDAEAVRPLLDPRAQLAQLGGHGPDPVRLLYAELGGVAQLGDALRAGRRHREDRQLVDRPGHQLPAGAPPPPPMLVPRSRPARTVRSPRGSPSAASPAIRRSVPIAWSTSMAPVRVGLRPTPSTLTWPSSASAAATRKNAADEMSPGT